MWLCSLTKKPLKCVCAWVCVWEEFCNALAVSCRCRAESLCGSDAWEHRMEPQLSALLGHTHTHAYGPSLKILSPAVCLSVLVIG